MKKFSLFLIGLIVFGAAHAGGFSFGVRVSVDGVDQFWVEQSLEVTDTFDVLVGGGFLVDPVSVDASLGVRYTVWQPEGADVALVTRASYTVYSSGEFVLGTPYLDVGVALLPNVEYGQGSVTFEVGATSDLDSSILSGYPSWYGRFGLAF